MQDDYLGGARKGVAPTGHANFHDKMKSQVISQRLALLYLLQFLVDALALLCLSV